MNTDVVEKELSLIERSSEDLHSEMFKIASNGKMVLASELKQYEDTLKQKQVIDDYNKFLAAPGNSEIIHEYEELKFKVEQINIPMGKHEKPSVVEPIEESDALDEVIEEPKESIPVVDFQTDLLKDNKVEVQAAEEPVMDEIEQEIASRTAEYEDSKAQEIKNEDSYRVMVDEELRDRYLGVEENESKKAEPEKKVNKKRKIFNRYSFKWNNNREKKLILMKATIFGEKMEDKSQEYVYFRILIANCRGKYKTRSYAENEKKISGIKDAIADNQNLSLTEKKRLLTKLSRLANKVERNKDKEDKRVIKTALSEGQEVLDTLDDEMGSRNR